MHEIAPYGVLGNRSAMPLCYLDDVGQVSATTVLHENVQNACFSIHMSIIVSNNILMMKIFQYVSGGKGVMSCNDASTGTT